MQEQCPNCARFLSDDLVAALDEGPRPCPHCGETVHRSALDGNAGDDASGASGAADPAGASDEAGAPGGSAPEHVTAPMRAWDDRRPARVRDRAGGAEAEGDVEGHADPSAPDGPTDVSTADVPDQGSTASASDDTAAIPVRDPLEGWDGDGQPVGTVASWTRVDGTPDAAWLAAVAAGGAAFGAVAVAGRRVRGATVGALAAAVGAAVGMRIWELRA